MGISLLRNISSLKAIGRLNDTSDALSKVYERLSSGQRINRASDDPAGLALSMSLESDSRVYAQAIRNVNDGLSLLNLADAALEQLSSISERQAELASQAANGILSFSHRKALNSEANALVSEFNRIVSSTKFNDRNLLDGTGGNLSLQVGTDGTSTISTTIANGLTRAVGDGTFATAFTLSNLSVPYEEAVADFNNDGFLDVIFADDSASSGGLFLGNGDGTFKARLSIGSVGSRRGMASADLNNDGNADFVTTITAGVYMYLGNGNGTFTAPFFAPLGTTSDSVSTADINNDGYLDVLTGNATGAVVYLNNGNGTFKARVSYAASAEADSVEAADFNNDGILDLYLGSASNGTMSIAIGNGDGTFGATRSYASGSGQVSLKAGDLNGDGIKDLVGSTYSDGRVSVFIGNGDGSFNARTSFVTSVQVADITLADLNGDGIKDIITAAYGASPRMVYLGNGDGTFKVGTSAGTAHKSYSVSTGDFNNDGVLDLAYSRFTGTVGHVALANTVQVATIGLMDLTTVADARVAMGTIAATSVRVSNARAAVGSMISRLGYTVNHLSSMKENYFAAASRIRDADVATEVASMVRLQILQQTGVAIIAQANQDSALILRLIGASLST